MAYPLQNLGAKMDTAVIMYGSEGPGEVDSVGKSFR